MSSLLKIGTVVGSIGVASYLANKWSQMDCDWTTYHSKLNKDFFSNRIIWITGASSGIGEALVHYIASLKTNCKFILTARRETKLNVLKQQITNKYGHKSANIFVLPMDLNTTNIEYLRAKYEAILSYFGAKSIDILINNAGFSMRSFAVDFGEQDSIDMIRTNLISPIVLTKMVLSDMINSDEQSGQIVNVSSVAARYMPATRTSYVATKSGLLSYGYALNEELKEYPNISVSTICPGAIRTDVDITARGKEGKGHQKRDDGIQSGMNPQRCAELICIAICNKIVESWPMKQPSLSWFYRCYYLSPSAIDGRGFVSELLKKDAGYLTSKEYKFFP